MIASEGYSRLIDRLKRSAGEKAEDRIMADVRDVFFSALSDLPDTAVHDLFNFYTDFYYSGQLRCTDVFEFGYHLGRVLDVLSGEYDERYPLETDDEWDAIREMVNEAADDMDLGTVTTVMNLLLERKKMG